MSPRILIVRLSALGDVTMASGLIPALHARWPEAKISWLVEPASVPLLRHNKGLDEVIVWPRREWAALLEQRRWRDLWRAVSRFRAELRARRFDLALDAQGLLKSGLMAWMTGAPRRVGLDSREGSRWLMTEQVLAPPVAGEAPMSREYRQLARALGAPDDAFQLDLAVGDAPRQRWHERAAVAGLRSPMVALCPFTTRPQKHWFEDRWAALATALMAEGMSPVLLGGPGDREAAARIASACPSLVSLVGEMALDDTVAAIADCALVVGVDTGLTHMGTALKVPTLALFGSTRPYLDAGTPRTRVLYEPMACSPCRRNPTCGGRFDCMRHWEVSRVLDEALRLWRGAAP